MGTKSDPNPTNPDAVFPWLKTLPLAPEFHPSIHEFKDPIGYIFKIEKEASKFGICKIVPPVPPQSRKSVISNLNKSFSNRNPRNQATFTTRMQQIGVCKQKGGSGSGSGSGSIQKSVWQSGENYTVQQFEAKAKGFAKNYVKDGKKGLSALEIETLYWKANGERPFSVEYANDMPGSGFFPVRKDVRDNGNGALTVGETAWNMRGISRANGSLLKFMKEEIPGVTSPMVYIAMMFSWFAWHVEDHDLHSLNYLHMGAGKTWYGVPRDAALAFEEVIRVHGYGDETNPLVTFAMLGEKTTVMSPEVLVKAGVSCCRLVQNAGEFVVTFPRAYHSGFSHGFNVGEASNIATPEWLRFAKDAAIRRASINYPPMVSHFQLLYDLALGIGSRSQDGGNSGPRSSRLKDRKKGEGETLVKQLFLEDVLQNNDLLHTLGKDSTVVLLPPNSPEKFSGSHSCMGSKYNPKHLTFGCSKEDVRVPRQKAPKETNPEGNRDVKQLKAFYSVKAKFSSVSQGGELHSPNGGDDGCTLPFELRNCGTKGEGNAAGAGSSKRALFSCVKCGIWPFACAAIVQPTDSTARYLVSADTDSFDHWIAGSGVSDDGMVVADFDQKEPDSGSGSMEQNVSRELYDAPFQCADLDTPMSDQGPNLDEFPRSRTLQEERACTFSASEIHYESSALSLLAMTYANSSDSEDDDVVPPHSPAYTEDSASREGSLEKNFKRVDSLSSHSQEEDNGDENYVHDLNFSKFDSEDEISPEGGDSHVDQTNVVYESGMGSAIVNLTDTEMNCFLGDHTPPSRRCDDDSSRMHVFCLEHAVEIEKRLRPLGGVHIFLLCHPEYPKVEAAAKQLAEELELDQMWNDTAFREATEEDEERIQLALEGEEASPKNGDWTIKLGINLYYSATLCRSPLYSKKMPYNAVIYHAFSCGSPPKSRLTPQVEGKGSSLVSRKNAKKRKVKVESRSTKKTKLIESEAPDTEHGDSLADESSKGERIQEIATSDCEDYFDVESHKMKELEEESLRPCIVYKRTNKRLAQPPDEDNNGSGPVRPKRIRKPRPFPDEDEMEVPVRSRKRIIKQRDFSPELEEEAGPSTRLRKRTAVASDDLDAKPIIKKEKNAALPRKGPRVMLPITKASGRKGPRVIFPVTKTSERKGPRVILPVSKTSRVPKKSAAVKGGASKAPSVKRSARHCNEKVEAKEEEAGDEYTCDIEGCIMSFGSMQELVLHKRNICPVEGCDKKFFSHKYLVQHRRVHEDDRPLKCPWKGCKMSFKWAWARTEHIRVHTGARPYICGEPGCGQTFRFVSDFSRHKRKTGHSAKKKLKTNP